MNICMNRAVVLALGLSLVTGCSVWAQQPSGRPAPQSMRQSTLDQYLIPPGFLLQHRDRLKLSQQQQAAIQAESDQLQAAIAERQSQLRKEVEAMEGLLKKGVRDEAAVLGQLDRLLNEELKVKRMQLVSLLRVRNQLTDQQLAEIGKIREEMVVKRRQLEQRLNDKLRRVQQLVQRQAEAGRPPNEVVRQMQEFPKLMQQGKVEEAEAVLDRALQQLGG